MTWGEGSTESAMATAHGGWYLRWIPEDSAKVTKVTRIRCGSVCQFSTSLLGDESASVAEAVHRAPLAQLLTLFEAAGVSRQGYP